MRWVKLILEQRRKARLRHLRSLINEGSDMRVLDVGCGTDGRSLENWLPESFEITGVDLYPESEVHIQHPNFRYYRRSAEDLSLFDDKSFDVAYSIGMMEHICEADVLHRMAAEINRVATQFVIVVPWRYAWFEPHFKFPFFQLLPRGVQNSLTKTFNLHGLGQRVRRDKEYIPKNYQWFSSARWEAVYPGSKAHLLPTLEMIALVKRSPDRLT